MLSALNHPVCGEHAQCMKSPHVSSREPQLRHIELLLYPEKCSNCSHFHRNRDFEAKNKVLWENLRQSTGESSSSDTEVS